MTTEVAVPAKTYTPVDADWWRQAVVYQIYPRSFADSDGNGIGDLNGIRSRVDYLAGLGIDAVWLSPFYPSALADGGYDVDDYRDVAPELGTLADFDALTADLHARGIRMIVDIVPNHTSNRHAWFVEALASPPGSPARERYIFRDGLGEDGSQPPSDWQSSFGGPAWTRVPDGQWYLHLFAPEQPDLNWDHPDVREDFLTTLRFWSDRGVDGFRVDVAHYLTKDLSEPLPSWAELHNGWEGPHPYCDRDEVHDIYAAWRQVFNSYDPPRMAVAEAWVPSHQRPRYASLEGLGQAFNFDLLTAPWSAEQFRGIIAENLELAAVSGSSTTWVLSNHDVVRHASRYGNQPHEFAPADDPVSLLARGVVTTQDRELGSRRASAATLLLLALPGSTYLYQGEELGLFEVAEITPEQRQDPTFFRTNGERPGRDGCRVPLPWTADGPSYGFGPTDPHLPQPDWFADHTVAAEETDPESSLNLYRTALRLRRDLQTAETLEWHDSGPQVVHFARPNGWHSLTNFGSTSVPLPDGEVLLASAPLADGQVPGDTTVWFRPAEPVEQL
ncbi:MAG: glycoside hydrolase family 13 protein [Microlunatus sp.]